MEFKEGNKVVIVKALLGDKEYYHGGTTSRVPLNSEGKIIKIDPKGVIFLKLSNGKEWRAHHREIQLQEQVSSHQLSKVPNPYVFSVATKTPIFLLNDRMYVLDEDQSNGFGTYQTKTNGKTRKFGLVESASLGSLEELTYFHNLNYFNKVEREYLDCVVEQKEEEASRNNQSEKYRLIDFIVNEILPHFKGKSERSTKLEKLFGVKASKQKKNVSTKKTKRNPEVEGFTSKLIKEIEKEKFPEDKQRKPTRLDILLGYDTGAEIDPSELPQNYKPNSLLGKVLEGKNVAIVYGVVYNLLEVKNSKNEHCLSIKGGDYNLISPRPVFEVREEYDFELSKQLRIQTLETKLINDKRVQELEEKDARLKSLVRKDQHREGDCGFILKRKEDYNYYYVFLQVPEHVLKLEKGSWDRDDDKKTTKDQYYLFKSVRVATKVFLREDKIIYERPLMVEPYSHPFSSESYGYAKICLGRYNYDKLKHLDEGEAVAKLLVDTKNTLLSGYIDNNTSPERRLYNFSNKKISLATIKRKGLRVTNEKLKRGGEDEKK